MPDPGIDRCIAAVASFGGDDAWAVGNVVTVPDQERTLTMHWDGMSWRKIPSPSPSKGDFASLGGVGGAASDDVWAVGECRDFSRTLTMHWDGSEWRRVPSPTPGHSGNGAFLSGVFAASGSDVWAVGDYVPGDKGGTRVLLLHWDGVRWAKA
jgi:hypothetical protein